MKTEKNVLNSTTVRVSIIPMPQPRSCPLAQGFHVFFLYGYSLINPIEASEGWKLLHSSKSSTSNSLTTASEQDATY